MYQLHFEAIHYGVALSMKAVSDVQFGNGVAFCSFCDILNTSPTDIPRLFILCATCDTICLHICVCKIIFIRRF